MVKTMAIRVQEKIALQIKRGMRKEKRNSIVEYLRDKRIIIKKRK